MNTIKKYMINKKMCLENKAETGSGANQSVPKKKEEKHG